MTTANWETNEVLISSLGSGVRVRVHMEYVQEKETE